MAEGIAIGPAENHAGIAWQADGTRTAHACNNAVVVRQAAAGPVECMVSAGSAEVRALVFPGNERITFGDSNGDIFFKELDGPSVLTANHIASLEGMSGEQKEGYQAPGKSATTSMAFAEALVRSDILFPVAVSFSSGSIFLLWAESESDSDSLVRYDWRSELIESDSGNKALSLSAAKGDLLAAGKTDCNVHVYARSEGAKLLLRGHTDWVTSVAFSHSSTAPNEGEWRLLSASQDRSVRIWRIERGGKGNRDFSRLTSPGESSGGIDGAVESVLVDHEGWVTSVRWNPVLPDEFLSSSMDGTVSVWRELDGVWASEEGLGGGSAAARGVLDACYSPSGKTIASLARGGSLLSFSRDCQCWEEEYARAGHTCAVTCVKWLSHGLLATSSEDMTARIWGSWPGVTGVIELSRPLAHGHPVFCIERIVDNECAIRLVTAAEEKPLRVLRSPSAFYHLAELSLGGNSKGSEAFRYAKLHAPSKASVPAQGLSNRPDDENHVENGENVLEESQCVTARDFPPTESVLRQGTLWPEEHKLYGHGNEAFCVRSGRICEDDGSDGKNGHVVLASSCRAQGYEAAHVLLWCGLTWRLLGSVGGHWLTVMDMDMEGFRNGLLLATASRDRGIGVFRLGVEKSDSGALKACSVERSAVISKAHGRAVWAIAWLSNNAEETALDYEGSMLLASGSRDGKAKAWRVTLNRHDGGDTKVEAEMVATMDVKDSVTAMVGVRGRTTTCVLGCSSGSIELAAVTYTTAGSNGCGTFQWQRLLALSGHVGTVRALDVEPPDEAAEEGFTRVASGGQEGSIIVQKMRLPES